MLAAELEREGIKASVIYGALPYDTRKMQMERFIKGETEVVVATDAIGMGLNQIFSLISQRKKLTTA